MPDLSPTDRKVVQKALAALPGKIKAAQEKEMGEMMGKLKDVSSTHAYPPPPPLPAQL
jgi:hypothetical protein